MTGFKRAELKRSQLADPNKSKKRTKIRTSKQVWVNDNSDSGFMDEANAFGANGELNDPNVETKKTAIAVSKRIQHATLLNLFDYHSSEPFQIVNYGLGGQYNTHPDPFGVHLPQTGLPISDMNRAAGDRIMTFMIYLSSVELGGGTAFPAAGISTEAVEGTAVLWKNMFLDTGVPDPLSIHGGCPVAVGSKWITNKWIHLYDQMGTFYKCPTEQGPINELDIIKLWTQNNA